jgi:hypothetical protein
LRSHHQTRGLTTWPVRECAMPSPTFPFIQDNQPIPSTHAILKQVGFVQPTDSPNARLEVAHLFHTAEDSSNPVHRSENDPGCVEREILRTLEKLIRRSRGTGAQYDLRGFKRGVRGAAFLRNLRAVAFSHSQDPEPTIGKLQENIKLEGLTWRESSAPSAPCSGRLWARKDCLRNCAFA